MGDEQQATEDRKAVKKAAADFTTLLHTIGATDPRGGRLASADLTLALRHIEDAEARALRHIDATPKLP